MVCICKYSHSAHTHTHMYGELFSLSLCVCVPHSQMRFSLDVSCIRLIAIYHRNDEMLIPFLRLHYISGGTVAFVVACGCHCHCNTQIYTVSRSFRSMPLCIQCFDFGAELLLSLSLSSSHFDNIWILDSRHCVVQAQCLLHASLTLSRLQQLLTFFDFTYFRCSFGCRQRRRRRRWQKNNSKSFVLSSSLCFSFVLLQPMLENNSLSFLVIVQINCYQTINRQEVIVFSHYTFANWIIQRVSPIIIAYLPPAGNYFVENFAISPESYHQYD